MPDFLEVTQKTQSIFVGGPFPDSQVQDEDPQALMAEAARRLAHLEEQPGGRSTDVSKTVGWISFNV